MPWTWPKKTHQKTISLNLLPLIKAKYPRNEHDCFARQMRPFPEISQLVLLERSLQVNAEIQQIPDPEARQTVIINFAVCHINFAHRVRCKEVKQRGPGHISRRQTQVLPRMVLFPRLYTAYQDMEHLRAHPKKFLGVTHTVPPWQPWGIGSRTPAFTKI